MLAITKKELRTYFTSFPGYIFLAGFILLIALFFYIFNITGQSSSFMLTLANPNTLMVFLVLIPILTMQLFSEEVKHRTDQLLFTSPITIPQIVLGKYIGAFCLFIIGMAVTLVFPVILSFYGSVSFAETLGTYLGFILLGACFIAVGMFVSCLTNNTIVAGVGSFAVLFFFYIMDAIASSMPTDRLSSAVFLSLLAIGVSFIIYDATKNIFAGLIFIALAAVAGIILYFTVPMFYDAVIFQVVSWFSVFRRFVPFAMGVLSVSDVVYYLVFAFAFIYLTINTLEKRRWK